MTSLSRRVLGSALRFLNWEPSLEKRFSEVYAQNLWRDDETRSGEGSRRDSACVVDALKALAFAIDSHGVRSINDIPCGDFNWIGPFLANHPGVAYCGFDIVEGLIEANRARHRKYRFEVMDVSATVPPPADLILCKDLLNHLDYATVRRVLANMAASGSRLLLASNNFGLANSELWASRGGASRHLDITSAPLDYPQPVWSTHYLGLWQLADFR